MIKQRKQKKFKFHQKKDNKLLITWNCLNTKECDSHSIKIEIQKTVNLLDTTSDDKDLPSFVTKKWIELYDQSEKNYKVSKEIRIKSPMLRADYVILAMHILL